MGTIGIILVMLVMTLMSVEAQKTIIVSSRKRQKVKKGRATVGHGKNCFNGFEIATPEWYKTCVTTYDVARWRSVEVTVLLSANARSSPEASSNGLRRRVLLSEECPCGKAN